MNLGCIFLIQWYWLSGSVNQSHTTEAKGGEGRAWGEGEVQKMQEARKSSSVPLHVHVNCSLNS